MARNCGRFNFDGGAVSYRAAAIIAALITICTFGDLLPVRTRAARTLAAAIAEPRQDAVQGRWRRHGQTTAEQARDADGVQGGLPVPAVMAGAGKIAKIRAVAVAENARGNGLGETLIKRTVRTYRHLGFRLIYGQFSIGSGLETYYARQGFTVLDEGQGIDLRRMNLPIIIHTDPSDPERLFTRWQ